MASPQVNFRKEKSGRLCIELNSHSLSYFQQCEKRYQFSDIELLETSAPYYPFKRGEGIAKALEIWYLAKQRNYNKVKLEKLEDFLFKKMMRTDKFVDHRYNKDDRLHIASRMMGYFNKYRYENYPIVAVEQGFSKVLYEDKYYLFVYSGRPDLVLDYGIFGIGPMDHKSESRESNIVKFNNQFAGYCWALGSNFGIINYIGLQDEAGNDKSNSMLRRDGFCFTKNQIERWKSDTLKWFYRLARSIQTNSFERSWRCEGKYGTCLYYNLCTSGTQAEELIKIKREFVRREKAYKSW